MRPYAVSFSVVHSTSNQTKPATKKATTIAINTGIMLLPSLLEEFYVARVNTVLKSTTAQLCTHSNHRQPRQNSP